MSSSNDADASSSQHELDPPTILQQRLADLTLVSSVTPLQKVNNLVLRWVIELLELDDDLRGKNMKSGLKALVFRRYVLPSRILCTASKAMVDKTNIFILLQQTWSDCWKTVDYHNRCLKLPAGCVEIVKQVGKFRRSYMPKGEGNIVTNVYNEFGYLKWMSEGLVSHLHEEWSLTLNSVARYRPFFPSRKAFGKAVADRLIGNRGQHRLRDWSTANSRAASQPLICSRQRIRVRSKSSDVTFDVR